MQNSKAFSLPYRELQRECLAREAAQQEFDNTFPVVGTDSLLVGPRRHPPLRLPELSLVAIDTNLLVYLAQLQVPIHQAKAERVLEILQFPLEFVICESAFVESMGVIMKNRVSISGVPEGGSQSMIREARLNAVKNLFNALSTYKFAQPEEGRASYLNVLRLVSTRRIQTYDARVIIESADLGVCVFISEDCGHGELLPCVKEGVLRNILVWNALKHAMELF